MDAENFALIGVGAQGNEGLGNTSLPAPAHRVARIILSWRETIINVHLLPLLGETRLDAITSEKVQQLKSALHQRVPKTKKGRVFAAMAPVDRSPKTVNNILTTLSTMLKIAMEWGIIERMPCTIKLLRVSRKEMAFHDFEEYERLVEAAEQQDKNAYLLVLLAGEAGLRLGEIQALEWGDVDLPRRPLCVQRNEWKGHVGATKGGRSRHVNMTVRLASALKDHRHLSGPRVPPDPDRLFA
jgi:integrase